MKERPILFSAPMVRAILDGSKTQTRRAVESQWHHFAQCLPMPESLVIENGAVMEFPGRTEASFVFHNGIPIRDREWQPVICPYGEPGDRLWIRETFIHEPADYCWEASVSIPCRPAHTVYRADSDPTGKANGAGWTPSIHMPRALSRITLEVTGVRVERLQSISDEDCIAEGIGLNPSAAGVMFSARDDDTLPRAMYRDLWEKLYGVESWDANPWVWVIEFKRVDGAKGA